MKIIACLGNPGRKYKKTRHNIGFIIGEYMAAEYNIAVNQKRYSSINGSGKIEGIDLLLMFPQTYMNNSGKSVQQAMDFYRAGVEDLIVLHDEIELSFGEYREKSGGGHKGHNGLRSIVQHIGSADFHRIRFGVGRPENPHISIADYVLGNFTNEEMESIEEILPEVSDLAAALLKKGDN